jgi:EAL domain-containing protein (putative c-di-GMP-specific phosphodiesterase class I)
MGMLERYRCNEVQGYFISHPLSAEEATEWLSDREKQLLSKQASGF